MPRRDVEPRFSEPGDEGGKPMPAPAFVTFAHLSLDLHLDMSRWLATAWGSSVLSVSLNADADQEAGRLATASFGPRVRRDDPA